MITGIAHTAVCVPDVDAAVAWYESVLGLSVLSPSYRMEGAALDRDMGELVEPPVVLKAAIVGLDGDRVLEVIEYPTVTGRPRPADAAVTDFGFTHVGLVCDDIDATRAALEARGTRFLTTAVADLRREAGVRTTWFADPWDNVFILVEKRDPSRPYWSQLPR